MGQSPWTDATDRKLLLSIIHLTAPQLPKWDKVQELMGEEFTAESVRQHFQKLRKDCKAEFGEVGSAPGTPAPKPTPRKAKKANGEGETPKKLAGKRKKKDEGRDGEDSEGESPLKKKAVKVEDQEFE